MATGNWRRGRSVALPAAAVATIAVVAAIAFAPAPTGVTRPLPSPAEGASGAPPAVGPVVYYELLDADASVLMARRLDGQSQAREIGRRPEAEIGRTWAVDPTGTVAIAALPTNAGQRLIALRADDGSDLWQLDMPAASIEEAVFSADGRRVAWIGHPGDSGATEAFVIDTRNGHLVRTVVPDAAVIQAFDAQDALVLREHRDDAKPPEALWRFSRIDPATNTIAQLADLPEVGPSGTGFDDADPALGIGVTTDVGPNDRGTAIQAWPLAGGAARTLAVLPSIDHLAIDPNGKGVVYSADQRVGFLAWDGGASDLWHGTDGVGDVAWSADGSYLAVTGDTPGNLWLVERATGRTVTVPVGEPVAESSIVRVVGGVSLPTTPVPADDPGAASTPPPAGPDIEGAPAVASAWFDTSGPDAMLHVERLVPTRDGGLRVAAAMPPIDVGRVPEPDQTDRSVLLLPRPGTRGLLVWAQINDRTTGWLWDGTTAAAVRLPLPKDWPAFALDIAWRPDGGAIAGDTERLRANGDSDRFFVVAGIGAKRTTTIAADHGYDRVTGWWSPTELRVAHAGCDGECTGRFAWSARLHVPDGRLVPLRPADRARGVVDEVMPDGRGGLLMTAINDDPRDDIRIDWPILSESPDGPDILGFASDDRSLLVGNRTPTATEIYRIDEPAARAVRGRLLDPRPTLLGRVAGRFLDIRVSRDGRWAISVDRVNAATLTELSTGRRWPIDAGRTLEWWP